MLMSMIAMLLLGADTAHVVMVPDLRRSGVFLKADDLGPILAKLAIHRRLAIAELGDPIAECIEHSLVVAQIRRLDELDSGEQTDGRIGLLINAFDQNPGEQEIGKDNNAAKAESRPPARARHRRADGRPR